MPKDEKNNVLSREEIAAQRKALNKYSTQMLLSIILLSVVTASAVALWSPGSFSAGWQAAFWICIPGFLVLWYLWKWGGKDKQLAAMILAAFALRLGFGLATQNLLPKYGYPDEPRQKEGYLFDDAFRRDNEAWGIVQNEPRTFFEPITRKYDNDQYGGMIALGIWIYRYLSPDARRFSLIFLIGAFFTAAGAIFLRKAIRDRGNSQLASIAGWIYVLYPDSIFYSGAAMREPFLIGIVAAAFWALSTLKNHMKKSLIVLAVCLISCLPFSDFIAGALLCISILWIWVEFLISQNKKWLWGGITVIVVGVAVVAFVFWPSISNFIHFDIVTTEKGSGWVEKVIGEVGGKFRPVFLAFYGITQPVLPAILVYPTRPYWKVVGIIRAVGWYAMVPFLFYALFSTLRVKDKKQKALLTVNAIFLLVWIFVASLRAGGDQWDNPRYRVIFIPWLAYFSAWGYCFAKQQKDWWLVRWIAIELIFLFFFTQWYISRYSGNAIRRFPFWKTVIYILIGSALVFATGWIEPILHKKKKN